MIADHKVAFADGGVVLDLERREADLVLAVAGAPGDDFAGDSDTRLANPNTALPDSVAALSISAPYTTLVSLAGQKLLHDAARLWLSEPLIGK